MMVFFACFLYLCTMFCLLLILVKGVFVIVKIIKTTECIVDVNVRERILILSLTSQFTTIFAIFLFFFHIFNNIVVTNNTMKMLSSFIPNSTSEEILMILWAGSMISVAYLNIFIRKKHDQLSFVVVTSTFQFVMSIVAVFSWFLFLIIAIELD